MVLQRPSKDYIEGEYIHTSADGKLYNIARLRAKTKITKVLIRECLLADDAALTSHSEGGLQQLVTCFSHACKEFGLTISLKKTNVMAQGAETPPNIVIDGYPLEVVESFTYLGSTISSSLTIDNMIARAVTVMAQLKERVWSNPNLTEDQTARLPCLRTQHFALWQRDLDHLCKARKEAQ